MKITHHMDRPTEPIISVTKAVYVDGYRLRLTFNDGTTKVVDFADYLRDAPRPWIMKYWELAEFKNFKLSYGRLMWGDCDLVPPVFDLHQGRIDYDFVRNEDIPVSYLSDKSRGKRALAKSTESLPVSTTTLRRLKARAKKEDMPVDLLVERYLTESLDRQVHRRATK